MLQSLSNLLGGAAGTLAGWMVSPWLFLAGAALISSPILNHLLNKRKFKRVDWAAISRFLSTYSSVMAFTHMVTSSGLGPVMETSTIPVSSVGSTLTIPANSFPGLSTP